MCGIVGYIGKNYSRDFVIEGLSRLEYRGYDSSGYACINPADNRLLYARSAGQLSNLVKKFEQNPIDGNIGIGHTRWSTHGVSSQENAHPQFDCQKTISIIHNGIIENHHALRSQLSAQGHVFHSETDTETIAHLFEELLPVHNTFKATVIDLISKLEGAYAFISILQDHPDVMLLVRKRSPLCVGIGDNEMFVASDLLAFAGKTKQVLFLPDQSFALVRKDMIELYDFSGKSLPMTVQEITADWAAHEKKGHEHYMLKEIYEQKAAIHATVKCLKSLSINIWDHIGLSKEQVKNLHTLNLIGCGTSWHAGRIAQFFFEQICMMPTKVLLASEFRYMSFFSEPNSLFIAISQSGETADTLEALRMINDMQLPTVALTNVSSSTMVREAGGFLLTQAGQEVAVASTKAFSTQVAALFWLANRMALEKGIITKQQMELAEEELLVAAEVLESCIENYKIDIVQKHARKYAQYKKSIFLGRHISYPFAMEASLKLKEIAYVFAQCYPAGELKHGPLALVDKDTPIFLFSHRDPLIYQKLLSNAQEVKARNGHLIIFAFEGQTELHALADLLFVIPNVNPLLGPLAMTGLMQFFVYHIALELGCAIDKPRNLAKSVTVE
ncbi:MAG: glutamine--fructose-6-phosphate transaminase (isomerizing) [Candidatus Dependentiae bacterium]|nr:glutamine--fructose-6-phosphate transaminase (isomerizing) [Candidatus Dependentiae bacterium]